MTLSPKLAALAAFPELANHHKSAEKYQEDDGYSHPSYARVIGSGTFTLSQNPQWGNTEYPVSVTGIAVVGGNLYRSAVPVHHTEMNKALFAAEWEDCGVYIITADTLRGWRDAAPYRAADAVREERVRAQATARREREASLRDAFTLAEQVAASLTASLGVKFTAERTSYGSPRLSLSLSDAESLASAGVK